MVPASAPAPSAQGVFGSGEKGSEGQDCLPLNSVHQVEGISFCLFPETRDLEPLVVANCSGDLVELGSRRKLTSGYRYGYDNSDWVELTEDESEVLVYELPSCEGSPSSPVIPESGDCDAGYFPVDVTEYVESKDASFEPLLVCVEFGAAEFREQRYADGSTKTALVAGSVEQVRVSCGGQAVTFEYKASVGIGVATFTFDAGSEQWALDVEFEEPGAASVRPSLHPMALCY